MTAAHQAIRLELPILVAIRPEPVSTVIVPFISEPHRNPVTRVGPQLFYQAIVEFTGPLSSQERLNLIATLDELGTVSPAAIWRIRQRYPGRIAAIPPVLGKSDLSAAPSVVVKGGTGGRSASIANLLL